jgi:hypothetical protein
MIVRSADFYGPGAVQSVTYNTVTVRLKSGKSALWIGDPTARFIRSLIRRMREKPRHGWAIQPTHLIKHGMRLRAPKCLQVTIYSRLFTQNVRP